MAQTILEEMEQIIQQLNEAADAYYNGQNEKMTDYEWDALFDKLKKIQAWFWMVLQPVRYPVTAFLVKKRPMNTVLCLLQKQKK